MALRLIVTTLATLHLASGLLDLLYMGMTRADAALIANTVLRFGVVAVLIAVWRLSQAHQTYGTSR